MVVIFWLMDKFVGGALLLDPKLLRVVKLGRILRLIRIAKNLIVLDALYLMTMPIKEGANFIGWACALLVG